jgi:hypothetical protein
LTRYAGIGSIIRNADDKLMIIVDTRYWTDRYGNISAEIIPYVDRVSIALGISKQLRMPPKAKENDKGEIIGSYVPAVLFPTYAVCKKCGFLHNNPWRKQKISYSEKALCEKCGSLLEQVTWCAVNKKGCLDDVPWHYICHQKSNNGCRVNFDAAYLQFTTKASGRKIIRCTKCDESWNYYERAESSVINKLQPWIYDKSPIFNQDDIVKVLEINDPRVYFPESDTALVIPPESRICKTSIVHQLFNNSKLCRELDSIKIPLRKKGALKKAATQFRCSVDQIKESLEQINNGYPFFGNSITDGELFEDEYKAFLKPLENMSDEEDFVTVHQTKQWRSLGKIDLSGELLSIVKMIDKHIIAKRVREIQVFKGFHRISDDDPEDLVPPDIIGESSWLPAIELFGEGLFFTLDENLLSKWEKIEGVRTRADEIAKRYEKSEVNIRPDIVITSRFILLHTLSHLLIRGLESTAGYPAASLKERIYCSRDRKMAGIFIYIVVADIVGSLGGIIESAEPKAFLSLLDSVFKHAQWCSNDPVCTEHKGQGPGWLNRAACHACALIPEPSCDYFNILLDRVFIKGNEGMGIPNFLTFIMENKHG